jgi:hypothetical protein
LLAGRLHFFEVVLYCGSVSPPFLLMMGQRNARWHSLTGVSILSRDRSHSA